MNSTFIIAEAGINHNGDIDIAKKLIDTAVMAGCDAIKFQKRTINKVYTPEYLASPKESKWGTTQKDEKEGLEFEKAEYDEIDAYCKEKGIEWFASARDVDAQKFLQQYNFKHNKIASAMLTSESLLEEVAKEGKYTFIATAMSTFEEIDHAVEIFRKYNCPFELMHCNGAHPMPSSEANLRLISILGERYQCKVGYSGHELGTLVSTCAVAMGATSIDRHITLNKNMYGEKQKAAIEPMELWQLVQNIRDAEKIIGTGEKVMSNEEKAIRQRINERSI